MIPSLSPKLAMRRYADKHHFINFLFIGERNKFASGKQKLCLGSNIYTLLERI